MEYAMLIFWIVLLVVLIIVEAATAQLVTIWFAAGAAAAIIAERCHAPQWLQWIVFLAVSVISLIATRPLVRKATQKTMQPTNSDRCIGQTAVVIEDINNIEGKGQVHVNGITWTARSADGTVFKKDDLVTVEKIDGVKLIVRAENK